MSYHGIKMDHSKIRACMRPDCPYPAEARKRKCTWHRLLGEPIEDQIAAAQERDMINNAMVGHVVRSRVPEKEWPEGERWCAGCQAFVPLFYCSGSRCKAHAAAATHNTRLQAEYGIDRTTYEALLDLQDGRCWVCRQLPRSKRLAVDHDHATGRVRGLLCADAERGCNHAVLGSIEARSVDGPVAALYRLIDYLQNPPYDRLEATDEREDPLPDLQDQAERGVHATAVRDRLDERGDLPDWWQ